ncbi:amidohydrolase family protein [Acidisoma cladoniae]|jgi:predicted TIM-barrel fold metal-dependent hydrolase|uniref:amidohydrolase family protein n=1 Tax=Acidisoma cladoniae TaxID=3040935 RepID=UPI00254BDF51|nr:amidohydrolase [Acidisoma sp. PAMC 29798]
MVPIIDTHLHLIYKDRLRYPWLGDVPVLNKDFRLQDYRAQADALGIEAALHMEVDVAEEDQAAETAFVTGLGAPVIGAIAACRPEAAGFAKTLEALAANPQVRGVRRILHTSADELGQRAVFAENLRRLAAYDLSFDLCVLARQLPIAAQLAQACPDVRFVLDHCGVPDVAEQALDPWRADIRRLAERPNVVCKISGIVAYAGADWTVETLRPFVEHCIEAFGWDRVVWGSDWPVCTVTADLPRWVAASRALVSGCSESEVAALFHGNARRLYRLG